MQLLPLNNGPVEKSSFHGCYRLGTPGVELEHPKVVVSWLLQFHVLFRIPPIGFEGHPREILFFSVLSPPPPAQVLPS